MSMHTLNPMREHRPGNVGQARAYFTLVVVAALAVAFSLFIGDRGVREGSPVGPGAGLFNRDFYCGCQRVLRPEGVFGLQSESPFLMPEIFQELAGTLGTVFKTVTPYLGPAPLYASGVWSWTLATDAQTPLDWHAERFASFAGELRYYNTEIHRAAFVLPNFVRKLL